MPEFASHAPNQPPALELTFRVIILAVLLTVVLATSNAYLALKLGILTSASIPAAIISMGILRFFKNPSILENNAVQTAASAGEAVAGGIVYTIPALIIIHYWQGFDYWTNFFIALSGGVLGVLFSIPLRRLLVHDKSLPFPEGRAIAEVLKSSSDKVGLVEIVWGGGIGAVLELFQLGFKVIASSWSAWFVVKKTLFGLSIGFSATMIGAGFLVGFDMALSILIGAVLAWLIALPTASHFFPEILMHMNATDAGQMLWGSELRYFGIGAMLFAGIWTFVLLVKPLLRSIRASMRSFLPKAGMRVLPRTEQDIPLPFIVAGVCLLGACIFLFFQFLFPLQDIGLDGDYAPTIIFIAVMYVLVVGFLFSVITAYFSGMVGVTASPGSSIVIAGILFAAWLLLIALNHVLPLPFTSHQLQAAESIVIVIGSMVTGIAAIANDNTQDLKVGYLVGATPWRQQLMLLLGVVVSSLVIPPVMQLMFDVYGIGGVMPHEGMDPSLSLPAPTAAMLAAIASAVFKHSLPWGMMLMGALSILFLLLLQRVLRLERFVHLSILGVAIGMYLPLTSSLPIFIGGWIASIAHHRLRSKNLEAAEQITRTQRGTLIACGLVAGSALMDVCLAIPFSILHSPDALSLVGPQWSSYSVALAVFTTFILALWIRRRVVK